MPRVIFHIDVNSAFLSWSAVKFCLEGKPDIRLVPSVVSGDPSDRRRLEDGTDCFEVSEEGKVIERHIVSTFSVN